MIESIFVRVVMKVTTKLSFDSVKLLSLKSISDLKNNLILNLTSFLNLTNNSRQKTETDKKVALLIFSQEDCL